MSKVRNLPEITSPTDLDLFYLVDSSEGPNGGRKMTLKTLRDSLIGVQTTEFLQYTNSAPATTSLATYTDLSLDSDSNSYNSVFFSKPSATEFECLFDGDVEIDFSAVFYMADNSRSAYFVVRKNGSQLNESFVAQPGQNQPQRLSSVNRRIVVPCTSGDIFTLSFQSPEASLITIPTNYVRMYLEVHRVNI